ncbi:MAG: hypothetical protein OXG85_05995 [Chloroflexi bacterium]|nr:hypothetical protein [Chloroflexota bacterium]
MSKMRSVICLLGCLALLAACQGGGPPPAAQTATAEAEALMKAVATAYSLAVTATAAQAETDAAPTATPTITATPDPMPAPVVGSIYVAEQRFENGWMFWLQPNGQIWVLTEDAAGRKIWSVYDDSFVEGEAESDPLIIPPESRFQPVRGFGKLWRENPEVRQALGWALDTERGHTTRYEYHHGGTVNAENQYLPAPGYHQVRSVAGPLFRFNEESFTWESGN